MRTFRREVTTEKMGITNDERTQVLEILQSMAYSKSEEVYKDLYNHQLMSTTLSAVKKYFNENWHSIRDEWVEGSKNKYTNFLNSTNNRLASINQKLKAVVSRHSSLLEFNQQLQCCLSSLKTERDHRATSIFQKRPINWKDFEEHERQYFSKCTPFAFKHIKKQLILCYGG
jgi:zinc finger SWIM domain-containing protein 3